MRKRETKLGLVVFALAAIGYLAGICPAEIMDDGQTGTAEPMLLEPVVSKTAFVVSASGVVVVDFDDLPPVKGGHLPSGYGGLEWDCYDEGDPVYWCWKSESVDLAYSEPHSGNNYLYNAWGVKHLGFSLPNPDDRLVGAWFAKAIGSGSTANTVRFNGYNALHSLVQQSAWLVLSSTPQYLAANFDPVARIEVEHSSSGSAWYTMDDLTYQTKPACTPPPEPANPDPCDGAKDVLVDTHLAWGVACSPDCQLPNGGFENGGFAPWTATKGPGEELTPWTVTTGGSSGYFKNGVPFEGTHFAQNGFDGEAGLFYDIYQEIAIPACAISAVLSWHERIQWDMLNYSGSTQPRSYVVSLQPAGGGIPLAILYTMNLNPRTKGDTGYVSHSVDLLSAAPGISGQTVRINFHEYIPQTYTGPAQFDLDGISLTCRQTTSPNSASSHSALQSDYNHLRAMAQTSSAQIDEHDSSAVNLGVVQAPQNKRTLGTSCFTFGGASESWSGASRLRTNVITVAAQQVLSEIKMELSFSGNRDLYFYVFESSSVAGPYMPVLEKVVPTVGIGRTFYSSGPISFVLDPGKYYGIGVAWGAGSSVTYYRNLIKLPVPWELGMVATHLYSDIGPPYTGPISNTYYSAIYSLELCFGSVPPQPPPCTTTYDVYLGTDSNALELISEDVNEPSCDPTPNPNETLNAATTYYWQVVAKNCCGQQTEGNVWSFTTAGHPPDCSGAVASISKVWPPNHKWVDVEILGVVDPDGDPVTITITGITQDEPVIGQGSGNTVPDGDGTDTSVARVRAERSGLGNGRVYKISFDADDGKGGVCSGSVSVCVPHDAGNGHECADDGQLYNSTAIELLIADLNRDGVINQLDFAILASYWLTTYELDY